LKRYSQYKDKYLFIVFPDKSYIYNDFLPDGFESKYRPGFNIYKEYFKDKKDKKDEYINEEERKNN
jgi:hypothetical protein